jgi:ribosomal protein S18 acetylase RimI-like enzyme
MKAATAPARRVQVRDLKRSDLPAVVRLDARHTGRRKLAYWTAVFDDFLGRGRPKSKVGLAADCGGFTGYLLGEVRAFEFGSEPCGWIFAVGVDPDRSRHGIASALLDAAGSRFRDAGVARVRTMVRRADVPVLSFFRSNGFFAGSFVQLELDLPPRAVAMQAARRQA